MATLTTTHTWAEPKTNHHTLSARWQTFTDGQKKNRTFWFLMSLVLQGVFFLPLPAALTYYYGAPFYIVGITLVLFFANVIAGMGGSGIRTMISLFAASVMIHLAMALIYAL